MRFYVPKMDGCRKRNPYVSLCNTGFFYESTQMLKMEECLDCKKNHVNLCSIIN